MPKYCIKLVENLLNFDARCHCHCVVKWKIFNFNISISVFNGNPGGKQSQWWLWKTGAFKKPRLDVTLSCHQSHNHCSLCICHTRQIHVIHIVFHLLYAFLYKTQPSVTGSALDAWMLFASFTNTNFISVTIISHHHQNHLFVYLF